jgi:hypothetical protein
MNQEADNATTVARDFNSPFSVMNNSTRQKTKKRIQHSEHVRSTDIHWTPSATRVQCTSILGPHRVFFRIDHKTSINTFKRFKSYKVWLWSKAYEVTTQQRKI